MTAARDYRDFLGDMVQARRAIIRFAEGLSLDQYLADEKTRYAVMRAYEILVTTIDQDLKPILPRLEALASARGMTP